LKNSKGVWPSKEGARGPQEWFSVPKEGKRRLDKMVATTRSQRKGKKRVEREGAYTRKQGEKKYIRVRKTESRKARQAIATMGGGGGTNPQLCEKKKRKPVQEE